MFQFVCDITTSTPTTPWAGRSGVQMSAATSDLSFHQTSRLAPAPTHPPIQSCFSLSVKWPRHEPDHSSAPIARIMSGSLPPLSLCTSTALFHLYLPYVQRCPTRSLPFRPSNYNFFQISFLSHSCCITHSFYLLGSHYINIC